MRGHGKPLVRNSSRRAGRNARPAEAKACLRGHMVRIAADTHLVRARLADALRE